MIRIIVHTFFAIAVVTSAFSSPTLKSGQAVLRSLAEIKAVSSEEVSGQRVDFIATVTYRDPLWNFLFVQQGDLAIFVAARITDESRVGQIVRIQGQLNSGDLSPLVTAEDVEVVGEAPAIEPVSADLSELSYGDLDARLVVADCEVVQVHVASQSTMLFCRTGHDDGRLIWAKVAHDEGVFRGVESLVGCTVRLTGTMGVYFDQDQYANGVAIGVREIKGFHLFCSSPSSVEVLADPPEDPVMRRTVDLARLKSSEFGDGRFFTHGQVSLITETNGTPEIVLFDDTAAIRMQLTSTHRVREGMVLVVGGTKSRGRSGSSTFVGTYLRQVNVERLLPQPVMDFEESIERFEMDKRVTVEGCPLKILKNSDSNSNFILLGGPSGSTETIDVVLQPAAIDALAFADPSIAKTIRVTGVMSGTESRSGSSSSFELIVSSSNDIELIERHPDNLRLLGGVLIGVLTAIALGAAWSRILQYQVDRKTKAVRGVATQLRYSYDAIDDGVLVVDSDGGVLAVNDEFRRLAESEVRFGDNIGDLPGHLASRLRNPDEFARHWESWRLDDESTSELEIELESEEPLHVVVRSSPVRVVDEDGPMGRMMMWRDETEQRRLQAELLHRNKLEAVGRLVAGVAHDFNNVLAAITGNLAIVRLRQNSVVSDVDRELEVAEDAAFRGADVIRRLLTYSKKTSFDLQPQSINAIVTRLSSLVRHTFDVSITFTHDLDPSDPFVNVESTAIEQVILNLYVNARDAMPNGGTIRTSTRVITSESGMPDTVQVSVEDGGDGVPDELVDKIFEPYFTTKGTDHGTGIGLSMSHSVVQQHGGTLSYVNRERGGSDFQILLPRVDRCDVTSPEPETSVAAIAGTVLVVDDEDDVRKAAQQILRSRGFETLTAGGGADAIAVLAEHALAIDVVLLDVTMPGMSGYEVMDVIRHRWPRMLVVLCSGYLMNEQIQGDGRVEPDGKIAKPYTADQLVGVISESIRSEVAD